MRNKKGIGPVVATALLIVVAVVALVSFQNWYQSYQSAISIKAESKNIDDISNVKISRLESGTESDIIYLTNPTSTYYIINKVEIDGVECTLTSTVIGEKQTSQIEISDCSIENEESVEVVVFTDEGILEEEHIVR